MFLEGSKSYDSDFELTNKWWKIVMDETNGKKQSNFTPNKKRMVEYTCEFMHKMKQKGIPSSIIQPGTAGDNNEVET